MRKMNGWKVWQVLKWRAQGREEGLSLVELLVFIGVGSVLIVTLGLIVSGTSRISRQQIEQGAITEKARVQLERMSDEIRNAQYIDCNLDADTADADEHWLYGANDFEIIVLSNVDDDVEAERVRYFVQVGTTGETKKLKRGVTQPGASLCDFSTNPENVTTVLTGLENATPDPAVPVFQYFTSGNEAARLTTPVIRLSSVLRVRLELKIDEDINIEPTIVDIVTDVVPRGVEDPGICVAAGLNLQRYSDGDPFADQAYNSCQSYCLGSASLPAGQCCPWSVAFYWDSSSHMVWSTCECADTYLPPDMIPDSVSPGSYTNFVRSCLNGTQCAGQRGEAVCEPNCLDAPGQCVCVCPAGLPSTTACDDGVDNDGDGTADCATCDGVLGLFYDPGCSGSADSSEWGTAECDDGQANDCDGLQDYRVNGTGDPDCTGPTDNDEGDCLGCTPAQVIGVSQCSDSIDNDCAGDGVGYAVIPSDPQCQNAADNNEWSVLKQCHDGFDNDGDGGIDSNGFPPDPDCPGPSEDNEWGEPSIAPTPTAVITESPPVF